MKVYFILHRFGLIIRGYIDDKTHQVGFYNDKGEDIGAEYPENPFYKETKPVDYRHFESIKDSFYIDLEHNNLADIILNNKGKTISRIFYYIYIEE